MPAKQPSVTESDTPVPAPPTAETAAAQPDISTMPKLLLALGRGKTGKSTFIRWAAEIAIGMGRLPRLADLDRTNATLAAFFSDVMRPESAEDDEVRIWLNDFIDRQITERFSVFLDLGGGDLILKNWARDLELAPFLESHGIAPVAVHFLSCDVDDLSYLRDIEENSRFQPAHTLLVVNAGLVPVGRVARTAFEPILRHPIYQRALDRGARTVLMPRLAPMHEIEERRLSFADARNGRVRPGQTPIGPVARQQIAIWLRRMDEVFADFISWMP